MGDPASLHGSFSKLVSFSKFLGFRDGFEEEILALLKKNGVQKKGKSMGKESKKSSTGVSKFERELKRLECSVSFKLTH